MDGLINYTYKCAGGRSINYQNKIWIYSLRKYVVKRWKWKWKWKWRWKCYKDIHVKNSTWLRYKQNKTQLQRVIVAKRHNWPCNLNITNETLQEIAQSWIKYSVNSIMVFKNQFKTGTLWLMSLWICILASDEKLQKYEHLIRWQEMFIFSTKNFLSLLETVVFVFWKIFCYIQSSLMFYMYSGKKWSVFKTTPDMIQCAKSYFVARV